MAKTRKKQTNQGFLDWLLRKKSLLHIWIQKKGLAPLAIFLVLSVPAGLYLVFHIPTMWAPDGGAHVARVFQIAAGGFRPVYINHEHGVGYGGSIPLNVNNL